MAKHYKFRKRISDRSGFVYREKELVKDNGFLVGIDELDQPPPSKKSLGGEGEVTRGENFNINYLSYSTPAVTRAVNYINSTNGITFKKDDFWGGPDESRHGWLYVAGSATEIDITADPQISAGFQSNILTLECVGSSITLQDAAGLALMGARQFRMDSGSLITFIYDSGNSVWRETSRGHQFASIGNI